MTTWAVIVAAGSGDRFGRPKQFEQLGERRVVDWAIAAAREVCDGVVVVVPPSWPFSEETCTDVDSVVRGGASRSESVRAGLDHVPAEAEVIVVHDAARPGAPAELFRRVTAAIASGADAAVPGLAVADTIKTVDDQGADRVVTGTPDRSRLVAVQTPQAFRAEALRVAHVQRGDATDDAALIEHAGGRVVVVEGDPRAHKITAPHDLALVAAFLGVG